MPDAFSMNSGVDSRSGSCLPAAIASAFFAFSTRTNSLKAAHSSWLFSVVGGCHTPCPVIEVLVVIRGAMSRTLAREKQIGDVYPSYLGPHLATWVPPLLFPRLGLHFGERAAQERRRRIGGDRHLELEHGAGD